MFMIFEESVFFFKWYIVKKILNFLLGKYFTAFWPNLV